MKKNRGKKSLKKKTEKNLSIFDAVSTPTSSRMTIYGASYALHIERKTLPIHARSCHCFLWTFVDMITHQRVKIQTIPLPASYQ